MGVGRDGGASRGGHRLRRVVAEGVVVPAAHHRVIVAGDIAVHVVGRIVAVDRLPAPRTRILSPSQVPAAVTFSNFAATRAG